MEFFEGQQVRYRTGLGWPIGTVAQRILDDKGQVKKYVILTRNQVRLIRTPDKLKKVE